MLTVSPIKAFQDNYIWCIQNHETQECVVVDPGDAKPVLKFLTDNNLRLRAILVTHHHFDHVGGISTLLSTYDVDVFGPANSQIKHITQPLINDDIFTLFETQFTVKAVPGHTLDHIAYLSASDSHHNTPWLFCGDTLFSGGCGRLFEGTPKQMFDSLTGLRTLPPETEIYCAHEYTLSNLNFAHAVLPTDDKVIRHITDCESKLRDGVATLPSTVAKEKEINLFLNCHRADIAESVSRQCGKHLDSELAVFAELRSWKDHF